ncbi:hypothetical protein C8J57DRAFT_1401533, partial [Mycena rebaudengoi]
MKPKDKVNEDDETEWEDFSDSEQSSEDEDADAELSNNEVAENLPAKLNPTLGKNQSRRSKPKPAKKKRKTTGGGKGKEKATDDGDSAQGDDARGKKPNAGSRTVTPPAKAERRGDPIYLFYESVTPPDAQVGYKYFRCFPRRISKKYELHVLKIRQDLRLATYRS